MKRTIGLSILGVGSQVGATLVELFTTVDGSMRLITWSIATVIGIYTVLHIRGRKRNHDRIADAQVRLANAQTAAWEKWGLDSKPMRPPTVAPVPPDMLEPA